MNPPWYQRTSKIGMYVLGGFVALGAVLDSVTNAVSLMTPMVAGIGTACVVLVWFLAQIILPSHPLPWVFGNQLMQVRKPGVQPTAFALGMVLLLWIPSVITGWQTPPPSSDKGILGGNIAGRDVLVNAPEGVIHTGQGNVYITKTEGINAERYTNIKRLGEHLFADYLLVKLYPGGNFDMIQSKTPGINLALPESVLLKIQGKWIVEESDIIQNPNRAKFRLSKIAEVNGRVLLQVDF
jgi:hypothetical protein